LNEQHENTSHAVEADRTKTCDCNLMRVARAVIGTLLLTVMLGNLVAYASPEWAASIGALFSSGRSCSAGSCPTGGCCPGMTSIGLPATVLESVTPSQHAPALPPAELQQP
jgi:hypothetical protein